MSESRSGLDILKDEKRVNDLMQETSGAKAIIRSGVNVCLFVIFLILYTALALGEPLSDHRAFEGYVRRRFDTSAAMPLREVESASSFWGYVNASLLPGVYGNDTRKYYYPGAVVAKLLRIEGGNRLFGVVRIRMLKVAPDQGCSITGDLERFFPNCYGPYMPDAEETESFGPPDTETGDQVFVHRSGAGGDEYTGKVSSYPPGGYMQAFTANHNDTMKSLNLMMNNGFIGPGTRAIFIDFTIYNFNLGCYAVCRLLFEIGPSSAWVNTFDVDVLMQRHLNPIAGQSGDWFALLGEIILVLFVLRYILEEASEFVGFHKKWRPYFKWGYFKDVWNLLDWLNLILMIVTLGYRISTWGKATNLQVYIGDPAKAGVRTFTDLSGVVANVRLIHDLIVFNVVLTWFKAVKYISVLPYITTFMQTVKKSQRALCSFVAVFASVLFGFVLAYSVAFGEQLTSFRTPWKAFVFLTRSFLGNADMTVVYDSAPFLGSLLIFLFTVVMFFVILNLFYAIMISALADAKQSEDVKARQTWQETLKRAGMLWNTIYIKFRLQKRFRSCVPGLYSRLMALKKARQEKEKERDDEVLKRERAKKPDMSLALGPGDPGVGRRVRRTDKDVNMEEVDSDDGSEADLGPLKDKEQLGHQAAPGQVVERLGRLGLPMLQDLVQEDAPPEEEAIEMVIKATRYVVDGIVDRTHGARGVLFGEMTESKEVLMKVGSVLEVLGRRARDLEAQQRQLLRHF